jgi:uroporphyrinogen decarboxylase
MYATKPDFNRVVKAFHHQEADRVPLFEILVAPEIQSQFLGRKVTGDDLASQVEFYAQAGYDFIPLTVGMMTPGGVTKESAISKFLSRLTAGDDKDESWNLEKRHGWFENEREFEEFPWDELAKLDLSKFTEVQSYLPAGMKIIAMSGKIFTLSWMLMGFENFAANALLDPPFVQRVVERVARIQLDGLKRIATMPNVAAVWAVDDIAFGSGPILSVPTLRRLIFPWYEEFGRICREHGLYFFFHSDGVLWPLLEDLIRLGVNALHPIDPTCMDIDEVKARVGRRLCLVGNISNELLANGTPDEVARLTKRRLKTLAPGGGYCLGSGNSVPDWASLDNYRAMVGTALKYGRYPITIGD